MWPSAAAAVTAATGSQQFQHAIVGWHGLAEPTQQQRASATSNTQQQQYTTGSSTQQQATPCSTIHAASKSKQAAASKLHQANSSNRPAATNSSIYRLDTLAFVDGVHGSALVFLTTLQAYLRAKRASGSNDPGALPAAPRRLRDAPEAAPTAQRRLRPAQDAPKTAPSRSGGRPRPPLRPQEPPRQARTLSRRLWRTPQESPKRPESSHSFRKTCIVDILVLFISGASKTAMEADKIT